MEFLLTYGWALLVVITAISALAYFGVLDPTKFFATNTCTLPVGLSCLDHQIYVINAGSNDDPFYENNLRLVVKNNLGTDYILKKVQIQDEFNKGYGFADEEVISNQKKEIYVPDITDREPPIGHDEYLTSGTKYEKTIKIKIQNKETGLIHEYTGTIKGKVS